MGKVREWVLLFGQDPDRSVLVCLYPTLALTVVYIGGHWVQVLPGGRAGGDTLPPL